MLTTEQEDKIKDIDNITDVEYLIYLIRMNGMADIGTVENLEYQAAKNKLISIYDFLKKKESYSDQLVSAFDHLKTITSK